MPRGRLPPASRPPSRAAAELRPPCCLPPEPRRHHHRRKAGGGSGRRGRVDRRGGGTIQTPAPGQSQTPLHCGAAGPPPTSHQPHLQPRRLPERPPPRPRPDWHGDPGSPRGDLRSCPNSQRDLSPCITSFEDPEHVLQRPRTTNHVLLSLVTSNSAPHPIRDPRPCPQIRRVESMQYISTSRKIQSTPIRDTRQSGGPQTTPDPSGTPDHISGEDPDPRLCLTPFRDPDHALPAPRTTSHIPLFFGDPIIPFCPGTSNCVLTHNRDCRPYLKSKDPQYVSCPHGRPLTCPITSIRPSPSSPPRHPLVSKIPDLPQIHS